MDIIIKWPDSIVIASRQISALRSFLQSMVNRLAVGHLRYREPHKGKCYQTRAVKELEAYTRTGNQEHLYNAANYCFLETVAPQHPNSHFDPTAKSATRRQLGGEKE